MGWGPWGVLCLAIRLEAHEGLKHIRIAGEGELMSNSVDRDTCNARWVSVGLRREWCNTSLKVFPRIGRYRDIGQGLLRH